MRTILALVCVMFCALVPAQAWWCQGHMLVATIAYQSVNSDVQQFLDNVAGNMASEGPFPKSPDFIQLACWPDDIRGQVSVMAGWHFINTPYNPQNVSLPPLESENVAWAITKLGTTLHYYKEANNWELAYAVANYMHFMGDISQPLHCTELFDSQFPKGDAGGNAFHITFQGQSDYPLHSVWDSVGGMYVNDTRPLSPSDRQFLLTTAQSLTSQYTFPSSKIAVYNSSVMADESYQLAVSAAYAGINPGDTLSDSYISNLQNIAQSQITLAGLRLGKQLTYYFGKMKANGVVDYVNKEAQRLRKH